MARATPGSRGGKSSPEEPSFLTIVIASFRLPSAARAETRSNAVYLVTTPDAAIAIRPGPVRKPDKAKLLAVPTVGFGRIGVRGGQDLTPDKETGARRLDFKTDRDQRSPLAKNLPHDGRSVPDHAPGGQRSRSDAEDARPLAAYLKKYSVT